MSGYSGKSVRRIWGPRCRELKREWLYQSTARAEDSVDLVGNALLGKRRVPHQSTKKMVPSSAKAATSRSIPGGKSPMATPWAINTVVGVGDPCSARVGAVFQETLLLRQKKQHGGSMTDVATAPTRSCGESRDPRLGGPIIAGKARKLRHGRFRLSPGLQRAVPCGARRPAAGT